MLVRKQWNLDTDWDLVSTMRIRHNPLSTEKMTSRSFYILISTLIDLVSFIYSLITASQGLPCFPTVAQKKIRSNWDDTSIQLPSPLFLSVGFLAALSSWWCWLVLPLFSEHFRNTPWSSSSLFSTQTLVMPAASHLLSNVLFLCC